MTLEEKAGLMQITSFNAGSLEDYLNQRNIRYFILRDNLTARELAARANTSQELAEKSRLGIPIVFASNPRNHVRDNLVYEEAEAAGEFSSWPGTLGLAATNDIKLIRAFADIARAEWRAAGIQKCYGYQVDVATEPRWYRIQTTFGESPKWNAEIAREIVLGFQGPTLGPESGMGPWTRVWIPITIGGSGPYIPRPAAFSSTSCLLSRQPSTPARVPS